MRYRYSLRRTLARAQWAEGRYYISKRAIWDPCRHWFRRRAIIINAYITVQQSDRLIGTADDDFDLIRARRARALRITSQWRASECASAENNKRYCAECDVI